MTHIDGDIEFHQETGPVAYEKIGWHFTVRGLVERLSDGSLWRASHLGYPSMRNGWCFRSVRRAWPFGWRDTGRIWMTQDGRKFRLANPKGGNGLESR